MARTLERAARLRRAEDFRRVLREGRRLDGPLFQARVAPNDAGTWRLGLAVARRLGGAVQRNRMRRLLRECFRLQRPQLPGANDVVLVAKAGLAESTLTRLCDEFERRMRSASGRGRARADGRR